MQGLAKQKILIGFLAYRDLMYPADEHFEYINFTADIDEVQEFLNNLKSKSCHGNDSAEDVVGALKKALEIFEFSQQGMNMIILICDDPCHGQQYHDQYIDDKYLDQEENILENLIDKYFSQIPKLNFYCFKITEYTDIMFSKIKRYEEVYITEQIKPEDFLVQVQSSITKTYNMHGKSLIPNQEELKQSIYQNTNTYKVKRITYQLSEFSGDIDLYDTNYFNIVFNQTIINEKIIDLTITRDNFTKIQEGQESDIYIAYEGIQYDNKNIIIKIPKNQNCKKDQGRQFARDKAVIQLLSSLLAKFYRLKSATLDQQYLERCYQIFYPLPIIYEILKEQNNYTFKDCRFLYAEPYINIPHDQFKKYSNNKDFIIGNDFGTFSHFTYQISYEDILLVDQQGFGNLFIDASIHTNQDGSIYEIRQKTNHGEKGIDNFFAIQHPKCTDLCKQLKLPRQHIETEFEQNQMSNSVQNLMQTFMKDKIRYFCDLCYILTEIDKNKYYEKLYFITQDVPNIYKNIYDKLQQHKYNQNEISIDIIGDTYPHSNFTCENCQYKIQQKNIFEIRKCQNCSDLYFANLYIERFTNKKKYCQECYKFVTITCFLCNLQYGKPIEKQIFRKDAQFVENLELTKLNTGYYDKNNIPKILAQVCQECIFQEPLIKCQNQGCNFQIKMSKNNNFRDKLLFLEKIYCQSCYIKFQNIEKIQCCYEDCQKKIPKLQLLIMKQDSDWFCQEHKQLMQQMQQEIDDFQFQTI